MSNKLNYTPAPWMQMNGDIEEPDRCTVCQNIGGLHFLIATIENGAPLDTLETEAANAKLIAASPDMYELIRRVSCAGNETTVEQLAQEAAMLLAKLEGQDDRSN